MKNKSSYSLALMFREKFGTHFLPLSFKRGDIVYHEGQEAKGIYFVESGLVGLKKTGFSGREYWLRFFAAHHFFGHRSLFSQEDYHGSAVSLEASKLHFVSKDIVLNAVKLEPHLLLDIADVLSRELGQSENQHVMILDHQINARVAKTLVFLKDMHADYDWTRQEIADYCASTVSTVIKALSEIEKSGYIKQNGRSIHIINKEALLNWID